MSAIEAARCETAAGGRCRCRCRGAFHGTSRTLDANELPDDDPHSPRRLPSSPWTQLALDLVGAT